MGLMPWHEGKILRLCVSRVYVSFCAELLQAEWLS